MNLSKIGPHIPSHLSAFSEPLVDSKKSSSYQLFSIDPILEKQNESFIHHAEACLKKTQWHLFQKVLEQKYHPKVVEKLFESLNSTPKTSLSQDDLNRFDVWCHYLDIEYQIQSQFYKNPSPTQRLMKRFLRYAQREVYHYLKASHPNEMLSHEQIDVLKISIKSFIDFSPFLVEHLGEELCHRALKEPKLIVSSVLRGETPLPSFENLLQDIFEFYQDEIQLRNFIENSSYETLNEHAEALKNALFNFPNYTVAKELYLQLAVKIGRTAWIKAKFPKTIIQKQAELFSATREASIWAKTQPRLIPIHEEGGEKTLNQVYFLKGRSEQEVREEGPIAVFKEADKAAAKEVLMYDLASIFGFQSAFAPTKLTQIKDKFGSIQTFQNGISWNDFYNHYLPPEQVDNKPKLPTEIDYPFLNPNNVLKELKHQAPANLKSKIEAIKLETPLFERVNPGYGAPTFDERFQVFQNELFQRVSMEDYLKAGFAAMLFGNRDLHTGNFFFVPKENGTYSLVMFDNEMCLYPSNYVLRDDQGQCHLPVRNALLIFPHADVVLDRHYKESLRDYINSFEPRFNQFIDYLNSSKGKTLMQHMHLSNASVKAFGARVRAIIDLINSDKEYTYRELCYQLFPLYPSYLSLVELFYPLYPEMMVGYHTIEELCQMAIEKGYMSEQAQDEFVEQIRAYEFKQTIPL